MLQHLTPGPDYRCARWVGDARPVGGGPRDGVQVGPGGLGVVASFCCLGGMLSAGGGCGVAVAAHVGAAWRGFRELLPVLVSRRLSCGASGCVCGSCLRGAVLRALGAWPFVGTGLPRLQRGGGAVVRQICIVGPGVWPGWGRAGCLQCGGGAVVGQICSVGPGMWPGWGRAGCWQGSRLGASALFWEGRGLHWFGHVARSGGAVGAACGVPVDGRWEAGGPGGHGRN